MSSTMNVIETKIEPAAGACSQCRQQAAPPQSVQRWINECIALCRPDKVHVCSGCAGERRRLIAQETQDQALRPAGNIYRGDACDIARREQYTFICTPSQAMAGPTNHWIEPKAAYATLEGLFQGCMKGRTMYVVPFVTGPAGSPAARVGILLTDSIGVVLNVGAMTRMGHVAWKQLGDSEEFTRCLHSRGDRDPQRHYICQFPQDNTIWSFGGEFGPNVLPAEMIFQRELQEVGHDTIHS